MWQWLVISSVLEIKDFSRSQAVTYTSKVVHVQKWYYVENGAKQSHCYWKERWRIRYVYDFNASLHLHACFQNSCKSMFCLVNFSNAKWKIPPLQSAARSECPFLPHPHPHHWLKIQWHAHNITVWRSRCIACSIFCDPQPCVSFTTPT